MREQTETAAGGAESARAELARVAEVVTFGEGLDRSVPTPARCPEVLVAPLAATLWHGRRGAERAGLSGQWVRPTPKITTGRCAAPAIPGIEVLGPAESPLSLIRGRHRYRLVIRAERKADIQGFLRAMVKAAPKPHGSLQVQLDVDPQSFL